MSGRFELVGIRPPTPGEGAAPERERRDWPLWSALLLGAMVLGCLIGPLWAGDPGHMDLQNCNVPPCGRFWFGTDAMGRDLFAMIWSGGRLSLFIAAVSTAVSTALGVVYGAAGGCAPGWLDDLLTRAAEILVSVPGLLVVVLLQAALGRATPLSLALVTGCVGWVGIARVVRAEVRRLRGSGFVQAARCMGGGFFYVLGRHLAPNFFPSILFMVVMDLRGAIAMESTLSFMGLGLPVETVTWGSMLSLSEQALLSGAWWTILIPGLSLTATLLCVTGLGEWLRRGAGRAESNL